MRRGTKWSLKDFFLNAFRRELTVLHAFTTCLSDIRGGVYIVSLKVIVGIRGLIEENMRMNKSGLDNVSARWTVQTRVS